MLDIPTLETEHLLLRPYRLSDFDAYAAMWQDEKVYRFIGGKSFTREQSWTRFLRQAGMWHYMGFGFWAIEDKATGVFGGECGFHEVRREMTPPIEGTMESGWGLAPQLQSRGLAEEAMRAALTWADENRPADRLTAIIDPGHAASQRVAEKLGFVRIGTADYGVPLVLFERPHRS
ncbi:MAG: GNAT family N-acetyltransferase [Devosia sp.]